MEEVIADLHVHSHFSIATGRQADLEHLDLWARYKGVQVVGTGDCTHPGWLKEMAAALRPAGEGVYELKPDRQLPLELAGPVWEETPAPRFVVTGEISTIYKKADRTRKVHLLLVLSSLEAAQRLSQRLARIGNIDSDGRPILGLDAGSLLELTLEIDPEGLVIPAHIWTPWFSALGAKSGFDSLEECFGQGLRQIYALETGLSSDPEMNWRVSRLDDFLLVSNSDAHSPQKLAREANLFTVPATFPELARAIRTKAGFSGTIEFFPQEGKYHLDGHRKCNLRLTPEEARNLEGRCPHCHKPLTPGVMHRVLDLADRLPGVRPPAAKPYESLIALPGILGEILETGAGAKKVFLAYFRLLEKLGPELVILRHAPLEALAQEGGSLLAYAIDKMRRREVHIAAGFDGVYGEIRLLRPEERSRVQGQAAFWSLPAPAPVSPSAISIETREPAPPPITSLSANTENRKQKTENSLLGDPLLTGLNEAQRAAVLHQGPPLIVQAGPGTGKTKALTHRLAYLLAREGVAPDQILALTFTRQAAGEMEARMHRLLPGFPGLERLTVKTFHALGHQILATHAGERRQVADEERRRSLLREAAREHGLAPAILDTQISRGKQALQYPDALEKDVGRGGQGAQPPVSSPKPSPPTPYRGRGGEFDVEQPPSAVSPQAGAPAPHSPGPPLNPALLPAFRTYEAALAREGLWDYEDLLARPVMLLAARPDLAAAYRERFRHILVDEYQDLNEAQYRLFRLLSGPRAGIMVIGDPDQAIYGFRGARPEYFDRFREDWPQAVLYRFPETYRLPPAILAAARQVRQDAGAEVAPMVTHRRGDQPLALLEAASAGSEAQAIARQIAILLGGLSHLALEEDLSLRYREPADRTGFKDVAVLYRLHALGPELERALSEAGIPWERPREGVGPELEGLDLAAERVKLLTLHAAKGLEFAYVFIAGCEAGLLPWEQEREGCADLDEENRLFYVGLTRASRQVFLSRARVRSLWGKRRPTQASPFLKAIAPALLHRPQTAHRGQRQPGLFPEFKQSGPRRAR
jgi:DNA helicase-2/ATP-dependent DNA helicase PcrA